MLTTRLGGGGGGGVDITGVVIVENEHFQCNTCEAKSSDAESCHY